MQALPRVMMLAIFNTPLKESPNPACPRALPFRLCHSTLWPPRIPRAWDSFPRINNRLCLLSLLLVIVIFVTNGSVIGLWKHIQMPYPSQSSVLLLTGIGSVMKTNKQQQSKQKFTGTFRVYAVSTLGELLSSEQPGETRMLMYPTLWLGNNTCVQRGHMKCSEPGSI